MQAKIPISEMVAHLRLEMPKMDALFLTRTVAKFLNALTRANPEAVRRLLFTELPIKPELAAEIGLAQRVKASGKCVATCFDLLVYICGFIRFPDDRIVGSLTTIYEPGSEEIDIHKIRGFIALTDIPLETVAETDDALSALLIQPTDKSKVGES